MGVLKMKPESFESPEDMRDWERDGFKKAICMRCSRKDWYCKEKWCYYCNGPLKFLKCTYEI